MSTIKKLITGTLKSKIIDLIRLRGPITVADYMKIVLTNPHDGFYMNNDVFGVKGHFTTNPEISQIFGEILGAWILQEWQRFKSPRPLKLIELGPGRGTLIADITRTIKALGEDQLQVGLIELSPQLRDIQRATLEKLDKQLLTNTRWYPAIEGLEKDDKEGFTAYIAHEFLDALPIHKFVKDPQSKKWREILIDYDSGEELRFCISKQPSLSTRLLVPPDFKGDHLEVCPQAALHLEKISDRLRLSGTGCALICDYGFVGEQSVKVPSPFPVRSERDTFRAFKNHQSWPPLRDPGDADLTADVDFGYLKRHLEDKAVVFGPVNQKDFLLKCGLQARLNTLMSKSIDQETRNELMSGASMIVDDMGDRYKFLSIFPKDSKSLFVNDPPAGFLHD